MSLINGCSAMEKEGHLGDFAILKWRTAGEEYARYGSRPIPTSWGQVIKLNDLESIEDRAKQNVAALDALAPGVRLKLATEKFGKLTPAEQVVLAKDPGERTPAEEMQARSLQDRNRVADTEVAAKAPAENRVKARLLADQIVEDQVTVLRINNYRGIINFNFWRARCEAEQLRESLAARDHLFKAEDALRKTDLNLAKSEYEQAFQAWSFVYKKYPILMDNAESQDLVDSCTRYNDVLGQLDEEFPADFVLNDLLDLFDSGKKLRALQAKPAKTPKADKPSEDAPKDDKPAEDKPKDDKPANTPNTPKEEKPTDDKPAASDKANLPGND